MRAKFNVRPDQILDLLTLTGDTVDNVPGVAKVGPKTAAKWLAQYGSLDNLIAHAAEIPGVVGNNLREALEWLPQGRRLLTVKVDCELPHKPADLAIAAVDTAALKALYDRFEFKSWLREVGGGKDDANDAAGAIAKRAATDDAGRRWEPNVADAGAPHEAPHRPPKRTTKRWSTRRRLRAGSPPSMAPSLRRSIRKRRASIQCRRRSSGSRCPTAPGRACYIPLGHRYAGAPDQLDHAATLARLAPWLADPAKKKLGQNLKYDQHALANEGLALQGVAHDTLLESYVFESAKPHDMDSLARRHLNVETVSYDDVTGKGANRIPFDQVALDRATEYAAEDADITLRLHAALFPRIAADAKLDFIYAQLEIPVREVLFRMERNGILIDAQLLAKQGRELGDRVVALEQAGAPARGPAVQPGFAKAAGRDPVPEAGHAGPAQDGDGAAFDGRGSAAGTGGQLPAAAGAARASHGVKAQVDVHGQAAADGQCDHGTCAYDVRAGHRCNRTARVDRSQPAEHPVRTAEGRRIREAFIAPPDHVLFSADYSQVELRIMAHLSEDPALLHAFLSGHDIHRATAGEIFSVAPQDVTSDQRRYIKAVNFGLIYGMSAFGLAQQLGIERGAAQQFIDKYFARYPGVAEYMRRTRELAREQGYVETVFGRRLWLPDIKAAGGPRRAGAERAAINAPMQGTAADLIKLAMIAVQDWLDRERLATRLLLQVHDELVLEVPTSEQDRVQRELPELMTGVASLRVPLVVDVGIGANWDRAHL